MSTPSETHAASPQSGEIAAFQPRAGCVVLAPHGEIDAYTAPALRDRIVGALEADDVTDLVVDLQGTTFLDSSALGVLVGALKRMRERDGRLALVAPPANIARIFEITSLDSVLDLYPSLEAALAG